MDALYDDGYERLPYSEQIMCPTECNPMGSLVEAMVSPSSELSIDDSVDGPPCPNDQ